MMNIIMLTVFDMLIMVTSISSTLFFPTIPYSTMFFTRSIGRGKMMVEFFSALMLLSVCKYLSCKAAELSCMTILASANDLDAFCSPSAAITLALASLAASASAAMALCSWTGSLASLLERESFQLSHLLTI